MSWDGEERPRSLALPFNLDLFPTTACTIVAAMGIFLGGFVFRKDMGLFLADTGNWFREPWRLLTTTLPHGDPIHLVLNVAAMVYFGRMIEARFGSLKTLGIYGLLAVASGAAQIGLDGPGYGLSGVAYGLFGILYIMTERDHLELQGRLSPQIANWLLMWLLVGTILRNIGWLDVGNVSHVAGMFQGFLLAMVAVTGQRQRPVWIAALVGATLLAILLLAIYPHANYYYWKAVLFPRR